MLQTSTEREPVVMSQAAGALILFMYVATEAQAASLGTTEVLTR